VPARDPTCSVSGCSRPTDGILTFPTAAGTVRVSACQDHGERARDGEWFTIDLLGSRYLLGMSADRGPSVQYEPLRR